MYDSDSNLERSHPPVNKHDHREASKAKAKQRKYPLPEEYLAFLNLNYTQDTDPRRRGYVDNHTAPHYRVADKPSAAQNQETAVPLGSRILGGFIIPPFFSLARNVSSKTQHETTTSPLTAGNFLGNLLSRITSPSRLPGDVDVVNIEHEFDVTGTRGSACEERRKAQAFLDRYLSDCLKKESSVYTYEEKKQMRKIQEILVREKEEERAREMEKEEEEEEEEDREKKEKKRRSKVRKGTGKKGEGKGKKTRKEGCGDEDSYNGHSPLGVTELSSEHPLFSRAFRDKVRIYTPSGTEVSVDSNGAVSVVDEGKRDDDSVEKRRTQRAENDRTRRQLRNIPPRITEPDRRRSRRRVDVAGEDEFPRKVMEENHKILHRLQIDQAREIELNQMIIDENKRTLKRLKMEKVKERLRQSTLNEDAHRDKKTRSSGRSKREPETRSESNTRKNSGDVIRQESDESERVEDKLKPTNMKACSTDMVLRKHKAERRRKRESREYVDAESAEPRNKDGTKHKEKDDVKGKTKRNGSTPEENKENSNRLDKKKKRSKRQQLTTSEDDDDSKSDNVQVVFHNRRYREGKSGTIKTPKHGTRVTAESSDVARKAANLKENDDVANVKHDRRHNIERDTESDRKRWIEKKQSTNTEKNTLPERFVPSSIEAVLATSLEETASKEMRTAHDYRDTDKFKTDPRGVMESTTTCGIAECSPYQVGHYGDVYPDDDVTGKKDGRQVVEGEGRDARPPPGEWQDERCSTRRQRQDCRRRRSTILTSSQESMIEVDKQRMRAIRERRKYFSARRRREARRTHEPRHRDRPNQAPQDWQTESGDWNQMKDIQVLESNTSHNSVMEILKAISKEDSSSRGLEMSTGQDGSSLDSENMETRLSKTNSRVVPKVRKVGLIVTRPKASFHPRNVPKDVCVKVEDRPVSQIVEGSDSQVAIQETVLLPVAKLSVQEVTKPTVTSATLGLINQQQEETEMSNVDSTKITDETRKQETKSELLKMLKKVHEKAEKLGKIRKLMEAINERSDLGDEPKKDILADMLFSVDLEGKRSENVKQVEKAVEQNGTPHSPDECVQQVKTEQVVTQPKKRNKDNKSRQLVFPASPESGTSPRDNKANETTKDGKGNVIEMYREESGDVTVPCVVEDLTVTRKKIQRRSHGHKQRKAVHSPLDGAATKHRTEQGGEIDLPTRHTRTVNDVERLHRKHMSNEVLNEGTAGREAKETVNAMACQENSTEGLLKDNDAIRTERNTTTTPSSFNNVRSNQMEEHMAKVLAEYLAKKQEFQKFIEQEELSKQQQKKVECPAAMAGGSNTQDGPARDVIRVSREVDLVRHVSCCCTHSVSCQHTQGFVMENVKAGVRCCHDDESKQTTCRERCDERGEQLHRQQQQQQQQEAVRHGTGVECHKPVSPLMTERENIMSLSHKHVKPLEFEPDKPRCNTTKVYEVSKPEPFSKLIACERDYVIKQDDASKQVWSPKVNVVRDEPRVVLETRRTRTDTNESRPSCGDRFEAEIPTVVLNVVMDRSPVIDEDGRMMLPQQRLAVGPMCAYPDANHRTKQQVVHDVDPTIGERRSTGTSQVASPVRRQQPSSNDVGTVQHFVEIPGDDVIQCKDVTCDTRGDDDDASPNIVSCIDTPDKAMEEIFKKMDDIIINRFLTLASINGITIVVTPRLVVNEDAQVDGNEENDDVAKEEVGGKETEKRREKALVKGSGTGNSKEVVYKIVSVEENTDIFSPDVYKNEPELTIGHRPECAIPADSRGESEQRLLERIETVIGNQERMQQVLAVRNNSSRRLEATSSCRFKRSDVYVISHVLCKSTGAIRREKKARLRRSKTTRTRSKPWRHRGVTRVGEPVLAEPPPPKQQQQQVVADDDEDNLRLMEEIALINVPDTSQVVPKDEELNFDPWSEQVLRCLPFEEGNGDKVLEKKTPQVVADETTREDVVPVDSFLEQVRSNLDEDELRMLEKVSRTTTLSLPVGERNELSVIYCSNTFSNSTSTTAAANIRTIEEIIAEADVGGENHLLGICQCFGVDNIADLMGRLTSSDDVVARSERRRRDRRRAGRRRREREMVKKERRRRERSTTTASDDALPPPPPTASDGRDDTTTTTTTDNSKNNESEESYESKEVWKRRRLSNVIDIDEWIRDGAVATRGLGRNEETTLVPLKSKRSKKKQRYDATDLGRNEETTLVPLKSKRSKKKQKHDATGGDTWPSCHNANTSLSKFVLNYALKSGIILGGVATPKDGDVNVQIELGDNQETRIVIQVPDDADNEVKVGGRSYKMAAAATNTPPHSNAQIVHVDSEEIVLSTVDTPRGVATDEGAEPEWTRAELDAFREALKRHPPTPRVWDRIAKCVGRSKRDCVLHFMHIWRRLETKNRRRAE